MVCLIVECTRRQRKGNKKNIQIVVGGLVKKWIEMSVLQLLLLKQKEVELLLLLFDDLDILGVIFDSNMTFELHLRSVSRAAY